jgi:hypothetical protein
MRGFFCLEARSVWDVFAGGRNGERGFVIHDSRGLRLKREVTVLCGTVLRDLRLEAGRVLAVWAI